MVTDDDVRTDGGTSGSEQRSDVRLTDGDTVEVLGRLAVKSLLETPGSLTLADSRGREYDLTPSEGRLELDAALALVDSEGDDAIRLSKNGHLTLPDSGWLELRNDDGTTCSLRGSSGDLSLSGHGGFFGEVHLSNSDGEENATLDGEGNLRLGRDVERSGQGGDVFLGDGNGNERVYLSADRDPLKGVGESVRVHVDGRDGVVRTGGDGASGTFFAENADGEKTAALFGENGELVLGGTQWERPEFDLADLPQFELEDVVSLDSNPVDFENVLTANFSSFADAADETETAAENPETTAETSAGGSSGGSDGPSHRYEKGGDESDPLTSPALDDGDPVSGTESRAGSVAVRNSHDVVTGSLSGSRGSLVVGGGSGETGADGDVVVNTRSGVTTCEIDGQSGRITVGGGTDGSIELRNGFGTRTGLFDAQNADLRLGVGVDTRQPAGSRIHLDGEDGSMQLGNDVELEWDGDEGTLSVSKQGANGGEPLFEFDADSETLTVNGDVAVGGTSVTDLAARVADLESKVENGS